jgi:hypothetical protein
VVREARCEAASLADRLGTIGAVLRAWRPLWAQHAFREPRLAWELEHPSLARALRALDPDAAARMHDDPLAADAWLGRWLPVATWRALEEVPARVAAAPADRWPRDVARDVPGRKWRQVEAFVASLHDDAPARLLDWCAGKAHLARALAAAYPGARVHAVERDTRLAQEAGALAQRAGLRVEAHCCDVLSRQAPGLIDATTHVCALHACGHLHLRLLGLAGTCRPVAISCAPCCYHLGGEAGARALSVPGSTAWPGIELPDLRTAVQETVTADSHARRRRQNLQSWQLGFDALARELRGIDAWMPLPAVDAGALRGDFAGFCRVLAARKGIALPQGLDFVRWERIGRRRFAEVSALDLVRQRFRRLIELFLVIDRTLYLHEQGYRVRLASFCERTLSPRNLLLQGRRAD